MRFVSSATVLAALSLAACDRGAPVALDDLSGPTALNVAANGEHRVVGSGHVPSGSGMREFTFHAVQDADGNAKGSYKIEFTASGAYIVVDVSCMTVVDNGGWVAGHIVETNVGSIQLGSVSYFYAFDNGEGDGTPDVISSARIGDGAGQDIVFCRDRPTVLPKFSITDGNVQVR